jgi:hypothetical protein
VNCNVIPAEVVVEVEEDAEVFRKRQRQQQREQQQQDQIEDVEDVQQDIINHAVNLPVEATAVAGLCQ